MHLLFAYKRAPQHANTLTEHIDFEIVLLLEPGEVAVAAAGVGDDVEGVVGVFGDDGVVDDAAALVEEHGERGGVGREGGERGGGEPFEEGGCGGAAETGRGCVRLGREWYARGGGVRTLTGPYARRRTDRLRSVRACGSRLDRHRRTRAA